MDEKTKMKVLYGVVILLLIIIALLLWTLLTPESVASKSDGDIIFQLG